MQRTPKPGSLQTLRHIQYVVHKEVQTSLEIKNVGRKMIYDLFTAGDGKKPKSEEI